MKIIRIDMMNENGAMSTTILDRKITGDYLMKIYKKSLKELHERLEKRKNHVCDDHCFDFLADYH